jgi:hypothetical protein
MQPQPSSIRLTLQSALDLKIALPVRIEPIKLDLFVRDRGASSSWGEATIPGITIKGNTTLGVSDTHTPLQNLSTWVNYVQSVVFQKESTLSIKGTTNSYLGVLKSKVTMNKDVTSPGKLLAWNRPESRKMILIVFSTEPIHWVQYLRQRPRRSTARWHQPGRQRDSPKSFRADARGRHHRS